MAWEISEDTWVSDISLYLFYFNGPLVGNLEDVIGNMCGISASYLWFNHSGLALALDPKALHAPLNT